MGERSAEDLRSAESEVAAHSVDFKKELGLRDLALTQIPFIIGLSWVGAAGKLGPAHVVFWLLAITFFYFPSDAVVIYLNRLMPLEGGLYQWAKLGFSEAAGFMVAWNLWLYVITNTSEIGLQLTTNLAYAIGPSGQWVASDKWLITLASLLVIALLVVVSTIGLGVGKWVHNVGGIFYALTYLVMFAIPLFGLRTLNPAPPWWLRIAAAAGFLMTLLYVTLSVFPIIEVKSNSSFTLKITAMIIAANIVGAGIFAAARARRRRASI